jgi:hypothetical protein
MRDLYPSGMISTEKGDGDRNSWVGFRNEVASTHNR